ncbi:hypothetical protein BH10BDE1_BH10BDE1_15020 [soil metagenome]
MFSQLKRQSTYLNRLMKVSSLMMATSLLAFNVACGSSSASFDLLSESASFNQSTAEVNGKIDILWVVDNSGSMATSQQAIAANFQRFIEKFEQNGFDFQIAVTTSDAYKDDFDASLNMSVYRSGTYTDDAGQTVTAPKILNKNTPNLEKAFIANILRGTNGSGDERVFQSMRAALRNTTNATMGFPRADAYLSVIMLSDEDDFSWDGNTNKENLYNDPLLHTVQSYVDLLDLKTASTTANRKFNVNSIAIQDTACQTALGNNGRKVAVRQNGLASMTNGILGSLCDDFGTTLSSISNKIIELSTQFYLDRTPSEGTLKVYVAGILVPVSDTDGYSYNATNNSITFHGTGVPTAGAQISVSYLPTELR